MRTRDDMSEPGVPLSHRETVPGAPAAATEDLPAQLGRYRIERRLGAGGMGVVYAAHDPELGRTVAIKLVGERIGSHGGLRERLRREAQALARLSHPNVVSVYDVGVAEGQLFIVMQYVDGVSLEAWLETHKPERSRMIAMFVQAGRGLAAAHAAGLVHRDFKPSNVLVEEDGTVRVTDFGLARLSDLAEPEEPGTSGPGGASLETSITRGDVVGTPAYMAPEQFRGGPITGATDQFGFCAALWEALTGIRPFPGENVDTIRNALLAGTIPAERARGLPRSLERILRRGLAVSMQDRYADMGALLDALTPSRRAPWVAAAIVVSVIGAGAAIVFARGGDAPCANAAADLDAVWTPAVRAELQTSFAALRLPDAAALGSALVAKLDERAERWRAMTIDTCEASRVRTTDDAAITARRTACLARSLDGLRAAIDVARSADQPTKASALAAVGAGTAPDECTAANTDKSWAAAAPALSHRLAELEAAHAVGGSPYVLANAPPLANELEAAGDFQGAARAHFVLASSSNQSNEVLREHARKAAVLAARAGDDFLEAKAWNLTASIVQFGITDNTFEELIGMAEAAAARSGRAAEVRLLIEITRGIHATKLREYDKCIAACQHALDTGRALFPDRKKMELDALGCLWEAYYHGERWPQAVQTSQARLALARSLEGESSGLTLECMRDAAIALMWSGKVDEGRAAIHETIERETAVFGAESRHTMISWWRLAQAESHDGSLPSERGLEASRRATAMATKLLGRDELFRGTIFMTHGDILGALDKSEEALVAYEGVLEVYDKADNPKRWAPVAYNVADGYINAGKCDRALPIVERIIALANAGRLNGSLGPTALGLRGKCSAVAGKHAAALVDLDEAIAQCDRLGEKAFAADFRIEAGKVHAAVHDRAAATRRFREVLDMLPADNDSLHQQLRALASKQLTGG